MKTKQLLLLSAAFAASGLLQLNAQGQYVAGDFHQHSSYTDGSWTISATMRKNVEYGLDWWANSEHGGSFATWGRHGGWDDINGADIKSNVQWSALTERNGATIIKGDNAESGKMWRWQSLSEYSIYDVLEARERYPEKLIIQGYEYNPDGHEHANLCIITGQFDETPNAEVIAQFEYMFDKNDTDRTGGAAKGWTKSDKSGKEKNLEALEWLQTNYKGQSWMVPTHPERKKLYSVADFRNMNNVAPDVCFGFDSQPGHQKGPNRGGYSASAFEGTTGATWGGTGAMAARIGGMWDALLSEGRDWWLFANSDFHDINDDFFPGEYQKTYTHVERLNDPVALIAGLRSGNSWIVTGDLIDSLNFTIDGSVMGSTLVMNQAGEATIKIIVRDPQGDNHNTYSDYTNPELDHIDLIAGEVTGKVDPSDSRFDDPNAPATKVIARFDAVGGVTDGNNITSQAWTDLGNGVKEMICKVQVNRPMYYRLRGTNLGLNVPGETDENGNPLVDVAGENNAAKAFGDLWFYSNPIFVNLSQGTGVNEMAQDFSFEQKDNYITLTAPAGTLLSGRLVNMSGMEVTNYGLNANDETHHIDLNGEIPGFYLLSLNSNGKVINKKIQVK